MAEYIKREAAIAIIEEKQKELCPVGRYGRGYVYGSDRDKYDAWDEIVDALENISGADVAPVVRCKDCKFCEAGAGGSWCTLHDDMYAKADYFCADGERRAIPGDDLKALADELSSLNDENLAQRVLAGGDVQRCLSKLSDILEADIETVTRCEDCVHWTADSGNSPRLGSCEIGKYGRLETDYCSYGERKEHE